MQLREREHETSGPGGPAGPGMGEPGNGAGNLSRLRQDGSRFHAAGAGAIDRALSGDSEKFVGATRQLGGQ